MTEGVIINLSNNLLVYGVWCNCRPLDKHVLPVNTAPPVKEEDDAHSTTSYGSDPVLLLLLRFLLCKVVLFF